MKQSEGWFPNDWAQAAYLAEIRRKRRLPWTLGFASARADAQRRLYSLEAEPLSQVEQWIAPFRRFWDHKLGALATEVARGKRQRRSGD